MRSAERLFQDTRHRLTRFRNPKGSAQVVVCFEPGRNRMEGFIPSTCPGFALRLGIDAITVQTARRDWFVPDEARALEHALRGSVAGYAEVTATGFSMGGYGALLYSGAIGARRALLVSPQYSIDPQVAPWDPDRHGKFARIGMPMPRPEAQGSRDMAGVLLYDPTIAADRHHAERILAGFPALHSLALRHAGHPASSVIGAGGGIGKVAEMIVSDRLNLNAVRQMHRNGRRQAESYRLNIAVAASKRHPARALPILRELAATASPAVRLEAGLALLHLEEAAGIEALSALMAETPKVPASWLKRIGKAMHG